MTERRDLCTWRTMSGALLLTMGLMAMPAMGDHAACDGAAGDCCIPVKPFTPGCNDPACCHDLCTADPFCCDIEWDLVCAAQASAICGNLCG